MIYNTTRTDRDIDKAVDDLVGQQFGLLHKIKNGSIGSEPFVMSACSPDFDIDFNDIDYNRKCNLELRPKGVIIHFRKNSSSFIWPIPFHHLTIYKSGRIISIFENTSYLKIKTMVHRKKDSPFIQRLLEAKSIYTEQYHII